MHTSTSFRTSKIIALFIVAAVAFTAATVFAGDPIADIDIALDEIPSGRISDKIYDSSLLKTKSIAQVRMEVGNILLSYGIGGERINQITEVFEGGGVYEAELKRFLLAIGINEKNTQNILLEFDKLGIASEDTDTGSAVSAPSAISPSAVKPLPDTGATSILSPMGVRKCGVNTFSVSNECGVGAFKNAYVQCYDGYEEKLGGESSCKSSEVWQKYAVGICANRCGRITEAEPVSLPESVEPLPPVEVKPTEAKPVAICYIPDKLTKDYNQLILNLRKAEEAGDKETAEAIIKKITALKLEIEEARKKCLGFAVTVQPKPISAPTETPQPSESAAAPITIDRCQEVSQWENKIAYYEKLANLSDSELKEQSGFSREEVEKILAELPEGLVKVRKQCQVQVQTITTVVKPVSVSQTSIAEPVKPVVVESGQEVSDYYKAKIENITAAGDAEEQIQRLKSLKAEIDELIEKLIKGRKEMEVSEFNNLVSEIKVSKGEIKVDDVSVKTTDKKIFVHVGDNPVSVAPTSRQVLIQDKNLEVTASEVSIKDNALRVGNSEVKLAASKVAENLNVSPTAVELKEENERAVYKMKVAEPRKLLWFIPIKITKTLTADAESSNVLKEKLPWYAFLTTK